MIIDADAVFLQPPEVMFQNKGYQQMGTYFSMIDSCISIPFQNAVNDGIATSDTIRRAQLSQTSLRIRPLSLRNTIRGNALAPLDVADRLLWFKGGLLEKKHHDTEAFGNFSH